jgi:hypothetical protein
LNKIHAMLLLCVLRVCRVLLQSLLACAKRGRECDREKNTTRKDIIHFCIVEGHVMCLSKVVSACACASISLRYDEFGVSRLS